MPKIDLRLSFLLVTLLIGIYGCGGTASEFLKTGTSASLQHDFDLVRLRDAIRLSGFIEDYKKETGRYPFQGDVDYSHYVLFATREQQKYTKEKPPGKHKLTDVQDLIRELQSVLGDDIEIPFDLQRVPVNKPNYYIYLVIEDTYFVAVHVHGEFSFTNKIRNYYNKLEITNSKASTRKGVWLRSELLKDADFKETIHSKAIKPGYTKKLRERLGGNSAF